MRWKVLKERLGRLSGTTTCEKESLQSSLIPSAALPVSNSPSISLSLLPHQPFTVSFSLTALVLGLCVFCGSSPSLSLAYFTLHFPDHTTS